MIGKQLIKLIQDNQLEDMEIKFQYENKAVGEKHTITYFIPFTNQDVGYENETAIIPVHTTQGEYSE